MPSNYRIVPIPFLRPADGTVDTNAYIQALDSFKPGDACVIFTPDDTHFDMALAAIRRGIHVMITKPAVKVLTQHRQLYEEATKHNVLVMIEGGNLIKFCLDSYHICYSEHFGVMFSPFLF